MRPNHPLTQRHSRLTRSFQLRFAAIDLIETPSGQSVFLAINPSGKWLWLEPELGIPIAKAIATARTR